MLTREDENIILQALRENRAPAFTERHLTAYYNALDRGLPEVYVAAIEVLIKDLERIKNN